MTELKERVEERTRERTRAIVAAAAVLIFVIVAFCLYGLPALENASVRKAKVEVWGITVTKIDGKIISRSLELKILETNKIVNMWHKGRFPFSVEEMGEGNTYHITYKGLWGKKEIVSIELIQSRKELVKKMAENNEMPLIGDWKKHWKIIGPAGEKSDYQIILIERFDQHTAFISGQLYYDTTITSAVLKAVKLIYFESQTEVIARKVWIKEEGKWKFYQPKDINYDIRVIPQKDGSIEFELR